MVKIQYIQSVFNDKENNVKKRILTLLIALDLSACVIPEGQTRGDDTADKAREVNNQIPLGQINSFPTLNDINDANNIDELDPESRKEIYDLADDLNKLTLEYLINHRLRFIIF